MARGRKRSRNRSRTTTRTSDPQPAPQPEETLDQAHARMAQEWSGPEITDEEIEAEVEREEAEDAEAPSERDEADAFSGVTIHTGDEEIPSEQAEQAMHDQLAEADAVQDSGTGVLDREWAEEVAPGPHGADPSRQAHRFEPPVDWSLFERGPLAAGILILDALLSEARSSYIAEQVERLEGVLEEEFDWDDRAVLTEVAAQLKNSSNLPDIATAYREMVRRRAEATR